VTSTDLTTTSTGAKAGEAGPAPVTVLGLGSMGEALARALLDTGHRTTVWNRTPDRADALVADGAALAPTARDAVAASPLVIVCVLDHDVVQALLEPVVDALPGRAVINLTSATPERARQTAAWAGDHGIDYLSGSIMVPTPMIGDTEALILYSGSQRVFDEHRATLTSLAGDSDHLGGDPGLASAFDIAMLDIYFSGMTAFLHAAALVGADGIKAQAFLPYAERITTLLHDTLAPLATDVDAGRYPGDEDNVEMELAAADHIVEASTARGISTSLPELVRSMLQDTVERGHGRDGFSSVIEVLRRADRQR
jgi:3-hydroxyisobutyrate dehydrogenase-like beta-hydroxyacid dehydrogenase